MPKYKIHPFQIGSEGSTTLREAMTEMLGYKVWKVYPDYVPKPGDWIINWGSSKFNLNAERVFNTRESVERCISKVKFFKHLLKHPEVPTLQWTQEMHTAQQWAKDGGLVFCRTRIKGKDGEGIVLASKAEEVVEAPLYTLKAPCTREYRIQFFQDQCIMELAKYHKKENYNPEVKTGGNGWFYVKDVHAPQTVTSAAIACGKALGLDFGGIDVLYDAKTGRTTVLEANSAPELGPHSAKLYAQAFIGLLP